MGVNLLGKMKLYDLAKELNLTSKELLEKAKKVIDFLQKRYKI